MVFSRAFCFDLIIKGDKAARDACAEISPFFGLVGRTANVITRDASYGKWRMMDIPVLTLSTLGKFSADDI